MSDELPPTDEPRALAALLFGWAFKRGARMVALIALGATGVLLILVEILLGRPAFGLPFEDTPGFYALLGAAAVAAVLAVAHLWRVTLGRLPPADDAS